MPTDGSFGSPLIVWLGPRRYAFAPGRDVVVGHDNAADIRLEGAIAPTQVVLHHSGSQWIAVDRGEGGIFVDGVRMSTVFIHDGRAITLGDPQHGPRLVFQLGAPPPPPRPTPPPRPAAFAPPRPPPPPRPVQHPRPPHSPTAAARTTRRATPAPALASATAAARAGTARLRAGLAGGTAQTRSRPSSGSPAQHENCCRRRLKTAERSRAHHVAAATGWSGTGPCDHRRSAGSAPAAVQRRRRPGAGGCVLYRGARHTHRSYRALRGKHLGSGRRAGRRGATECRHSDFGGHAVAADYVRPRVAVVPRHDLLHPQLTVEQALRYAAEFRFTPSTSADRRDEVVRSALDDYGAGARCVPFR